MSENNKNFNVMDCRGLRPRNDGGPSAERNSLSWMPDRVGHDTEWGQGQSGRSMVEMLGVLAIVGVLSVGAIGGYSYAMNKHRTNELIYEATKRAQWVGTQLEMNNSNPSINTFGNDSLGGGRFTGQVLQLENGQIGIAVADLKEAVCDAIKSEIGDNTVLRAIKDSSGTADVTCEENGTAALIFNRDLGTTDSQNEGGQSGNEPEPEEPKEPEETATATAYEPEETTTGISYCSENGRCIIYEDVSTYADALQKCTDEGMSMVTLSDVGCSTSGCDHLPESLSQTYFWTSEGYYVVYGNVENNAVSGPYALCK